MPLSQPWELYNITDDLGESTNLIDGTYWNWLLYGGIADDLAADLRAWLAQDDPTWNPKQARNGAGPVPFPPAEVPDIEVPASEAFQILEVSINPVIDDATVTFTSAVGFVYEVQASSTPSDPASWASLARGIPGRAGTTSQVVRDPGISSSVSRFYRAIVRP